MFRNYIKIAWRNLLQHKSLSFINIFGLATGMAFAILIGLWIRFELSYDQFHSNKDRIAVVRKHTLFNNEKNTQGSIPLPLYYELKSNYPEVKRVSRMDWSNHHSLMIGDQKFRKRGTYVDPGFLKMFSFPLINGNVETALNDPNSIVITETLAKTLFGKENPMGRTIRMDNEYNVTVTGVLKDIPPNTSIWFEFLAPFEFKVLNVEWVRNSKTRWTNNFLSTVLEVKEGSSIEALSKKLGPLMVQKEPKENKNQTLILQPMKKWHLYSEYKDWVNTGGTIEYVKLFSIIGLFVLLIACINFMNLSTARSERRAREVGIRKAVGSTRSQLIIQFLSESVLTAILAFLLSILIMWIILPYLKDLGFEHVKIDFTNVNVLLFVFGVCLFTGLVAGSYPALYLSSFLPVKVLKAIFKQGRGPVVFRKVLVVSQFAISIALIISTVIIFQQIQHARTRPLGYNPDNLITIPVSSDLAKNYRVLKQELLTLGHVAAVSKASSPMTGVYNSWSDFSWDGKDPNENTLMDVVMTEWDYELAAGLKFKEGRPFSREFKTDSGAVILNEAAIKLIGYTNPVGRTIKLDTQRLTIVGVVENVLMKDPFAPVDPTAILFNPENVSNIFIRLKPEANVKAALDAFKPVVEKYNPSLPFDYSFVDEDFQRKFTTENQVAKLSGIFAGLAIFISCLGLFGLAAFMAERRVKEIGIRKVLGANLSALWMLLSKDFVLLVMIAFAIAAPVSFVFMSDWLENYDYRIAINWWIFIVAGLLALLIALITVSSQAIRAAVRNPIRSLRTE